MLRSKDRGIFVSGSANTHPVYSMRLREPFTLWEIIIPSTYIQLLQAILLSRKNGGLVAGYVTVGLCCCD